MEGIGCCLSQRSFVRAKKHASLKHSYVQTSKEAGEFSVTWSDYVRTNKQAGRQAGRQAIFVYVYGQVQQQKNY